MYEVKLVAYNGNGESDSSTRLVSLVEESMSNPTTGEYEHTLCSSNFGLSAVIKAEKTLHCIKKDQLILYNLKYIQCWVSPLSNMTLNISK